MDNMFLILRHFTKRPNFSGIGVYVVVIVPIVILSIFCMLIVFKMQFCNYCKQCIEIL